MILIPSPDEQRGLATPNPISQIAKSPGVLRLRVLMLRFRPHPARPDGEEDGWLAEDTWQIHAPIRLVRMVKEIMVHRRARTNLIHHPGKPDAAFTRYLPSFLARHLVHHPHKADGVRKKRNIETCAAGLYFVARRRLKWSMDESVAYHDAALICITFICDLCNTCLDSEDLPAGQPRFPDDEWFIALGDEAMRQGWYVKITENSLKTMCANCAKKPSA